MAAQTKEEQTLAISEREQLADRSKMKIQVNKRLGKGMTVSLLRNGYLRLLQRSIAGAVMQHYKKHDLLT